MYKRIEYFYLNFRNLISTIFEKMTCRTKPDYEACNFEEEEEETMIR
jgi:hypothetical protein